ELLEDRNGKGGAAVGLGQTAGFEKGGGHARRRIQRPDKLFSVPVAVRRRKGATMFNFARFRPTEHVIHYKNGKIKREGRGLSFFYWQPTSSIVAVPVSSSDLPFIFNETTLDFQVVAIQGQITYRIIDPRKIADLLDLTVSPHGEYLKKDYEKI